MDRKAALAVLDRNITLEKRAFKVVNLFIDNVTEDTFRENLNSITKSHYDDVIEERSISNMCAYPICENLLPPSRPQQYTIRTHTNKIYSLAERKKYCSDFCYEANLFVAKQIPESPLWWRENEPTPRFELLSPDKKVGLVGQELDITKLNISGDSGDEEPKKARKRPQSQTRLPKRPFGLDAIEEETTSGSETDSGDDRKSSRDPSDTEDDCRPKPRAELVPAVAIARPNLDNNSNSDLRSKVEHAERCFREWFTLESLLEIFDEAVVKEKYARAILRSCAALEPGRKLDNLRAFCKRIGLQDNNDDDDETARLQKPIENNEFEKNFKKVRSFFGIATDVTENAAEEQDGDEDDDDDDETPIVFPLLDRFAQSSIRKNIFLQSLNSAIRLICPIFDVSSSELQEFVVTLAKTFNLTAKNVTFNAKVTKYVGLLLLKIFAKKDTELEHRLQAQVAKQIDVLNEIDRSLESCHSFLNDLFDFQ